MRNTHLLGSLPIIASAVAAQDGILSFPVRATAVSGGLSKRQIAADAQSRQDGTIYTIDVSIGTPGQIVSLEIDTGSEEMWVNPICSEATYPALCAEAGRYSESSTLVDLAVDSSRLADDGYVAISYVYDTVSIGSTRIPLQIFGVATDTERFSVGQLGLGPSPAGWESNYPYVLDNLVVSRAINSKAFSLDLGRDGSEDGALIFGGIDTSRYVGNLERISVVSASDSPDGYTRYWITSSRVGVSRDSSIALISNTPIIFHLNSGSPISALPTAAFTNLLEAFPEASPAAQFPGRYVVPCTLAEATGSIDFSFGSTVINVPLSDFVWRQPEGCYLGAYSSEMPVLGANFLRAAYVVFDWDNREVHVANSARESCEPNLVAIGSGPDAVPSVVGSCQSSSTSSTVSSTSSSSSISSTSTSFTSATSSSSSSASSSAASTSSSLSSTLSTSTLSSSAVSSTSASSTLTTSTLSSSTLSSSTLASSTLSTSTLSSSTATSSTDISSTSASSTQTSSAVSSSSSVTDSSTDISSTGAPTSASTTTSVSISMSTASSSTLSDPDRLGGRETIYDSTTASLETSASSSDSTISSSATSSAYDGASTASLDGTIYPSDSTTSLASSSAYYPINGTATSSATSSEYNGVSTASLGSSTISSSAVSSTYYGDRTSVPTYDDKVCQAETISSSSSAASPTYAATSSQPTQEVYDSKTISSSSSVASPTYDAESSSSEAASSSEEAYGVESESFISATASPTYEAESSSSETTSSSASTEVPYEEKTGYRASDTASPTYGLETSSSATSTSSVSSEAPYEDKTNTSTTSTVSQTYGVKSSSSETFSSSESTEMPYEEKTDSSSAFYISSTDVPSYGDKAPYSTVPTRAPYKSDDYRDIPTITTILTTSTTAPDYDTVTSSVLDETTTITITATTTYTVTACSKDDPYCSVGSVTTKVVTRLTTACPEKTTATTSTASTSTSISDVNDYKPRPTSTKTSSIVTLVTSKTCTESAAYHAPTTSAIYEDMGHHGYGSGPQDDVYHEEEARNDGPDSDPIYNHDEFAYQDKPSKDGYSQPSPATTHPYGAGSSTQAPSPTKYDDTPAHSSASPVYTEPAYEHVTAGASAGRAPVLFILCVGILTVMLMQ